MFEKVDSGQLEKLNERIGYFRTGIIGKAHGMPLDILHQAVQVIAGRRDAYHTDGGAIPERSSVEFGDGDIEACAQTILQTANHLAAVFKRVGGFDAELKGEKGDHCSVVGPWSLAATGHTNLHRLKTCPGATDQNSFSGWRHQQHPRGPTTND